MSEIPCHFVLRQNLTAYPLLFDALATISADPLARRVDCGVADHAIHVIARRFNQRLCHAPGLPSVIMSTSIEMAIFCQSCSRRSALLRSRRASYSLKCKLLALEQLSCLQVRLRDYRNNNSLPRDAWRIT
jgi:hypothetical protein